MNAFNFKEARLLKLRKQQVTIAEFAVTKAAHEVALRKQAVEAIQVRISELDNELEGRNRSVFMHASQVAIGMRARLEESRSQLAEKQNLWAITAQQLRKANQAVEALSTLETRQRKQHSLKVQSKEQAEIDSFSTLKWVRGGHIHV